MEKETRNLLIAQWAMTAYGIVVAIIYYVSLKEGGNTMELWQALLVAIVPAIIAGFVTYLVSKNSQLKKNTEAISNLENKIGNDKYERSLQTQIGVNDNDKTLSEQLGVKSDDKSLTIQNAEPLKAVNSYAVRENDKLKKFNDKQKDIVKTVNDVTCFLKDWEQKTIEAQNLRAELQELQINYNKAIDQISSLTAENKALKHNYELLNAQMAPEMDAPGEDMELGQ